MNGCDSVIPTAGPPSPRLCHPERSRGIWLRTERMSQPRPDLSTSLRFAQGDKRGRGYAFTLIKLLVVIAVVALLMAILIPTLHRARNQARGAVCQSNLRQWAMTLATYTDDHDGRFPSDLGGMGGMWLLRGTFLPADDPNVDGAAYHHFHTKGIALCPMATKPTGEGGWGAVGGGDAIPYRLEGSSGSSTAAWEITSPPPPFRGSYGYNTYLMQGFAIRMSLSMIVYGIDFNVHAARGRADIPVLLDSTSPWARPRDSEPPTLRPGGGGGGGLNCFLMDRHGRHVNGMFLDWSVRPVGLKELWTLKWASDYDRNGPWTKAGGVDPDRWPAWMRECKDY